MRASNLFVLMAATAGCGPSTNDSVVDAGSDTSESSLAGLCDPLATHATTLATILGVGKDQPGILYVADQGAYPSDPSLVRVFVASGGSLVRQHVIGSGQIGNTEDIETFESPDGSTPARDLTLMLAGATASLITLGPESSGKLATEGLDGGAATPLTLVDAGTVRGMPAIDLPGAVQYVADAADGSAIVVTAPLEIDAGSSEFRLFYGPPTAMIERRIVSFSQSMSGYPTISFSVDSQIYVMNITSTPSSDGGLWPTPGPVVLTTGTDARLGYTLRLPRPSNLTGFTFSCLGPIPLASDSGP